LLALVFPLSALQTIIKVVSKIILKISSAMFQIVLPNASFKTWVNQNGGTNSTCPYCFVFFLFVNV
jgi:hypothetical protein